MKFSEYLASYITPQMTLLEKFNALCKYLEEQDILIGSKIYRHKIVIGTSVPSQKTLEIYDDVDREYTMAELNTGGFFASKNKISIKYNGMQVIDSSYTGVVSTIYFVSNGSITSDTFTDYQIFSQLVEKI